ncbi:hypothetical protein AHAS_Ahas20G0222500 [Arachis hypogaea]
MAPKTGESSRKIKGKAPASEPWETIRFLTKAHQDHFYDMVRKKKVIREAPFKLKVDEYSEILYQILRRDWKILANPISEVGVLMVQEFYANAWVTKKHDTSVNPEPKNWRTMVRGHIIDFSPESVRVALQLPEPRDNPHLYIRRVNTDQRLEQVLANICVSGAQWRRDAQCRPYQLGRLDLKPVVRGWLEFIQR